jgi:hypothetical protein
MLFTAILRLGSERASHLDWGRHHILTVPVLFHYPAPPSGQGLVDSIMDAEKGKAIWDGLETSGTALLPSRGTEDRGSHFLTS